jgi:hypothetical protein
MGTSHNLISHGDANVVQPVLDHELVEIHSYEEVSVSVCIGGRCARLYEPGLDDLLSVVDEAERSGQTPPEGPLALYLAS